jgi:hypothetical protein
MALAQNPSSLSHPSHRQLKTERGSYSFRGLQVAVGETSPALDIVMRDSGDAPLIGITAATHGDFVINENRCPQLLPPAGSGKNWCAISVAFRPSAAGMRAGDLTVQAAGVRSLVVPLVGGIPIDFPTVQPGATDVEWVELPAGTGAVSGTVTGPFVIALQPNYDYGSIDGVSFGATADTNGVCSPDVKTCVVYLGVEFLGTAAPGPSAGMVTLSNGLTYSLSANVLGPGLLFTPSSIDGGSVPIESTSDGYSFFITNVQSTAITLDPPSVSGPFSITNGCGTSLAANSSCSITVFFSPTATGPASGEVQVRTSVGNVIVTLTGTGVDNPANVTILPATINFQVQPTGLSTIRTVTIKNQSAVDSVQIGAPAVVPPGISLCKARSDTYCVAVVANDCATLAPGAACQIQLMWQGPLWSGALQIAMTPSSATTASNYTLPFNAAPMPSSPPPAIPSVSPSVVQFPATPFGQVSAPLKVTVTNASQTTAMITASSQPDFIIDPSCGPIAPNQSCTLSVRFVPSSGAQQDGGQLAINAYDAASTSTFLGSTAVSVSGFAVAQASTASPSYPPLIQPLDLDTLSITNTSTAPLVLYSIAGPSWTTPDVNSCSQPIPPGGSCSVALSYSCPFAGCSFSIASNTLSSPDVFPILGTQGSQPSGSFGLYQNGWNASPAVFPMTAIGFSSSIEFSAILANMDTYVESLIDVKTNISHDYVVDNQCPSLLTGQLVHGFGFRSTCFVLVTFSPTTPGFQSGTVTFTTNYGLFTIQLAGTAAASPLSVNPASLTLAGPPGQSITKTVTVTNSSTAAVSLAPPRIQGGPAGSPFSIGQTTCGQSLDAGAACTMQIEYASPRSVYSNPQLLSVTDELLIFSGMNNLMQKVHLTGIIPEIIATPNPSSFPPTPIGSESHVLFTVTTNQGIPITLQTFALTNSNPADFTIASNTCTAGLVLQGTMSCVIDVAFSPQDPGLYSTTLEIDSTAGTCLVTLTASNAPAPAQVSPTTLTFGREDMLVPSAPQSITLSNPNPAALTLPALPAVSGYAAADFSVTGNCTTIPPNGSCQLSVTFNPSVPGTRIASLEVETGSAVDPKTGNSLITSTTVNFTGVGVATAPYTIIMPAGLTFSPQIVGSTSAAQTVLLSNTGKTALSIASIAVTAGFQQSNTCGTSLAPQFDCDIAVTFAPTAAGPLSGTLTFTDNAIPGPTQTVSLSGTGTSVSISPGSPALSISAPGGSATTSIQLSSLSGFSGTVSLKCAVTYQGSGTPTNLPVCALSPGQVQVSGTSAATSTLSITTTGTTTARLSSQLSRSGIVFAALLLFLFSSRRRRVIFILLFSLAVFAGAIGCGSGGSRGSAPGGSTPTSTTPGNYSVVVTATSSPLSVSKTISLTVQ